MIREIREPIWKDENRDRILCSIAMVDPDNNEIVYQAEVGQYGEYDTINPDWSYIMSTYGEEYLDKQTELIKDNNQKELERQSEIKKEEQERQRKRKQQEEIFAKKLEIFEIPEIKESKNRQAKSKIRKAKSEIEAVIYAAKLIIEDEQSAE